MCVHSCPKYLQHGLVLLQLLLQDVSLHGQLRVIELGFLEVTLQHVVLTLQVSSPENNNIYDNFMVLQKVIFRREKKKYFFLLAQHYYTPKDLYSLSALRVFQGVAANICFITGPGDTIRVIGNEMDFIFIRFYYFLNELMNKGIRFLNSF